MTILLKLTHGSYVGRDPDSGEPVTYEAGGPVTSASPLHAFVRLMNSLDPDEDPVSPTAGNLFEVLSLNEALRLLDRGVCEVVMESADDETLIALARTLLARPRLRRTLVAVRAEQQRRSAALAAKPRASSAAR